MEPSTSSSDLFSRGCWTMKQTFVAACVCTLSLSTFPEGVARGRISDTSDVQLRLRTEQKYKMQNVRASSPAKGHPSTGTYTPFPSSRHRPMAPSKPQVVKRSQSLSHTTLAASSLPTPTSAVFLE